MRIGSAGARRSYTNNGDPCWAHKIFTDNKSCPLFYRGAKCPNFWPKFRPRSPSDRRILELSRFTGKQKQTCQGSIIVLSPYQSWVGWVPQLPEPLAQWVPQKVKVENFLYILHSSDPRRVQLHQCYTNWWGCSCCKKATVPYLAIRPHISQGVIQKGKSDKFLTYPPFQLPTPSTPPPMLYYLLGP